MMKRASTVCLAIAGLAILLAGCQARTQPIRTVSVADAKTYSVARIEVGPKSGVVAPETLARVEAALKEATDYCATGERPVILEARIDHYREAGTASTILIGDQSNLAGRVALRDPGTRRVLASAYVESYIGGGGLIGVAITELGEEGLPDSFANDVCENIWDVRPPGSEFKPQGPPNQD